MQDLGMLRSSVFGLPAQGKVKRLLAEKNITDLLYA